MRILIQDFSCVLLILLILSSKAARIESYDCLRFYHVGSRLSWYYQYKQYQLNGGVA